MAAALDRRGFLVGALGAGGAVLLLSSCGGDDDTGDDARGGGDDSGGGDDGDDLTTANVGVIPITDVAPLFLGIDQGMFADHGLELETTFAAGGAAILPSVESDEFDVGFSNVVSLMLAQSQGGEYKILAGTGRGAVEGETDFHEMLVLDDSDLEDMGDLGGRKVAINTLRNALEIVTRTSVEAAGGDQESIEFVEIPFPEMAAALQSNQVDAILLNEPFKTVLKNEGGVRAIGQPFVDAAPGEVLAFYFVKAGNAEGDLATNFTAAMDEANAYAADHEDEIRAIIPTYTEVAEDVAADVVLPKFEADSVPRSSLEIYAELMVTYGLVDEAPDIDALLP
jgi:NitT/TauT family transport system substrate-binding protein